MVDGHVRTQLPLPPAPASDPKDWERFVEQASGFVATLCAQQCTASIEQVRDLALALRSVPAGVAEPSRMAALVGIGQYCYVSGFAMAGIEPAVDGLNAARRIGEPLWLMRALNVLALNLGDTVDVAGAVEYYAEALEIAARQGNALVESMLWGNLGLALMYGGQYDDAADCFRRSEALAPDRPNVVANAQGNLALLAIFKQDVAEGLAHSRRAIDALPDPRTSNDQLNRVLAETYFARLLVEISDHDQAAQRISIAKDLAAASGSLRASHSAEVAEGLCEVARGQHDIGLSRLSTLLDKARSMRTALRDTLHALIAAYRYMDQPHKADVHVRELSFLARRSQSDYLRSRKQLLEQQAAERNAARATATLPASGSEDLVEVLERLAVQAEAQSDPSGLHVYRVGGLSALLASEIGLTDESVASMQVAGRLHDIGRWPLMAGLRASPTVSASDPVQERLKLHAEIGEELLSQVDAPVIRVAREAARSHHERWDGLGYPDGLAGPSIPLAGRIVAIANAFDAVAFPARGRGTQAIDRALDDLVAGRSTRFDPELVDAFVGMIQRLRATEPRWEERLSRDAGKSNYMRSRERIRDMLHKALPQAAE